MKVKFAFLIFIFLLLVGGGLWALRNGWGERISKPPSYQPSPTLSSVPPPEDGFGKLVEKKKYDWTLETSDGVIFSFGKTGVPGDYSKLKIVEGRILDVNVREKSQLVLEANGETLVFKFDDKSKVYRSRETTTINKAKVYYQEKEGENHIVFLEVLK